MAKTADRHKGISTRTHPSPSRKSSKNQIKNPGCAESGVFIYSCAALGQPAQPPPSALAAQDGAGALP